MAADHVAQPEGRKALEDVVVAIQYLLWRHPAAHRIETAANTDGEEILSVVLLDMQFDPCPTTIGKFHHTFADQVPHRHHGALAKTQPLALDCGITSGAIRLAVDGCCCCWVSK
jgi:hypothetical protein